jgi:hypothetical protein
VRTGGVLMEAAGSDTAHVLCAAARCRGFVVSWSRAWCGGPIQDRLRFSARKNRQLPDPAPRGSRTVQLLRTYPNRRRGYVFARMASIARSYLKVLRLARSLVYLEDQYLWLR